MFLAVINLATPRNKKRQGGNFLLIVGSLIWLQQGFWCEVILSSNAILIEFTFR
jgi:hypothetical protein